MQKVTIEDISRHTGLSRGTVSRALNDRPDISSTTKQRVLEACLKLNYTPSHAARSLATGRNFAVAVFVRDLQSSFVAAFLRGVLTRAEKDRYVVHVVELGELTDEVTLRLRALSAERIDAVLIGQPLAASVATRLAAIIGDRIVAVVSPIEGIRGDIFSPDYAESGRIAARFFLQRGLRDLLYVHNADDADSDGDMGGQARRSGFAQVCRENGLDESRLFAQIPTADEQTIERSLRPRLESARAIVADDDFIAIEVMLLLERFGRAPGRDVALLGQGNEPFSGRLRPALSTIDFAGEEIGQRAMETILARVNNARQDAPQTALVTPSLIERDTTRIRS